MAVLEPRLKLLSQEPMRYMADVEKFWLNNPVDQYLHIAVIQRRTDKVTTEKHRRWSFKFIRLFWQRTEAIRLENVKPMDDDTPGVYCEKFPV
jgi:hypothetical protein